MGKSGKSPAELYKERLKRMEDAVQLKVPDRVPIWPLFGLFPVKYTGIALKDIYYDWGIWFKAFKKTILDFEPDMYRGHAYFTPGNVLEIVDSRQYKCAGHGLRPDQPHQFIEDEYMKADEYDALLDDPTDFAIRAYLPRVYGALEPLKTLPPLRFLVKDRGVLIPIFTRPEIVTALKSIYKAELKFEKWTEALAAFNKEMAELGFPCHTYSGWQAPFDMIADFLRGTRGAMLDMYRQPDKLIAAMDKLFSFNREIVISTVKAGGNYRLFMGPHKGSDGFMSLKQFEKFYWPGFKKVIMTLVEEGFTPYIFFEGDYTQRLEYLTELPRGKILGLFDKTDIFKAKEILGNTMCIAGNMPVSLLQSGPPEAVKAYAKKLIDVVGKDGGFVMASRSSMDNADPELVKIWFDFTKEYGVY